MENSYNKYDFINTVAVRWLQYNSKSHGQQIGLTGFNYKNINHLWLLQQFKSYSIYNSYCNFYIKTNYFVYLYLKYFKGFSKLKFTKNKNKKYLLIESNLFIKELLEYVREDIGILSEIYNSYYVR